MKQVLAIDLGASSGRGILARLENGKFCLEEIHRFPNNGTYVNGTLYWDILYLYDQIKQAMQKAAAKGGFDSMGIDTWGVDYGLIDEDGALVCNPVHYRDTRTQEILEDVYHVIGQSELYARTGIQLLDFNTIFQLYYHAHKRAGQMERAQKCLLIPDLLNYFLTGRACNEYTAASTTQLLNPHTRQWDVELMEKLGIPTRLFGEIVQPGQTIGTVSKAVCEELCIPPADVVAVGSHDTASAVVSVPGESSDFAYISCGTWSLFGTELACPLITDAGRISSYTNEGGVGGTIRYLSNIMGLWLIQESRRAWLRQGQTLSFNDLEQAARTSEPFACFIDPDAPEFATPGNLPERIAAFCARTGQSVPQSVGETVRCIYESLALKYRYALKNLEHITKKAFDCIHIVGGGTKDPFLCQLTASSCNVRVAAGPVEATALGNIAVQLMAAGEIADVKDARHIIRNSFDIKEYQPQSPADWDAAYERFLKLIG